jgi:hypothetical protein
MRYVDMALQTVFKHIHHVSNPLFTPLFLFHFDCLWLQNVNCLWQMPVAIFSRLFPPEYISPWDTTEIYFQIVGIVTQMFVIR